MRYTISVLIRPEEDAEQGNLEHERWYSGTAVIPSGLAPSAVMFPGEGEAALFPLDLGATDEEPDPDNPDPEAVPEAVEESTKKGK